MTGHLSDVLNWWLLVRATLDGTTPHRTGAIEFEDRAGGPLDLSRSFTPADPAADMAWFLEQAGFLHIKGLYSEDEMAAVSAEMDVAATRYADGDGRSWWAGLRTDLVRWCECSGSTRNLRSLPNWSPTNA